MEKIVSGNILESRCDVILHQVNCRGVMGAGLAKQIRQKYPGVFQAYYSRCKAVANSGRPSSSLLGEIQPVRVRPMWAMLNTDTQIIINLFAQDGYGTGRCFTDYDALQSCLRKVNAAFGGGSVALPYKMSCGLAGGDWDTVLSLISRELRSCDIWIYHRS